MIIAAGSEALGGRIMCDVTMEELKRCPFCGSTPTFYASAPLGDYLFYAKVECHKCDIGVDCTDNYAAYAERKAIERWNTRYEPTCTMNEREWDDGQIVWGCKCSNCGEKFTYERGNTWSYCPRCGARVVDGDAS